MPKRSAEEIKIEWHKKRLKLLKQQQKCRRRVIIYSSSDSDEKSGNDEATEGTGSPVAAPATDEDSSHPNVEAPPEASALDTVKDVTPAEVVPEIDSELLSALGDAVGEAPKYGEKIHPDLAQRWLPILKKGLTKEHKDTLLKEYCIPENCKLLMAPSLNAELSAAVSDISRARDKKIEGVQQQLGVGITALSRAMTVLLTSEDKSNKIKAIKTLSDSCRILTDLHYNETQARIKLITPGLDRAFLNVMQDFESDETLFGSKLSEKIKASKAIEKQGWQIKKNIQKTSTPPNNSLSQSQPQQAQTRPRYQGNWTGPPRFQLSNRGGRGGGLYRFPPPVRRPAPTALPQTKTAGYNKQRVPTRQ